MARNKKVSVQRWLIVPSLLILSLCLQSGGGQKKKE
ncbi:hypothetical protein XELAEV_180090902mg, partial [Xenopus laevis]